MGVNVFVMYYHNFRLGYINFRRRFEHNYRYATGVNGIGDLMFYCKPTELIKSLRRISKSQWFHDIFDSWFLYFIAIPCYLVRM
jgi:hypothetical protein